MSESELKLRKTIKHGRILGSFEADDHCLNLGLVKNISKDKDLTADNLLAIDPTK